MANIFDDIASSEHGANHGMLRARAHRPAARPKLHGPLHAPSLIRPKPDTSLTPVQSPFATNPGRRELLDYPVALVLLFFLRSADSL